MRRAMLVILGAALLLATSEVAAFACGGLVAPGHAEVLQKATTLAAWHGGVEHYVTGFRFAGSASTFGYIVPLPAVPTRIEKGGDWTLERLEREIQPRVFDAPFALASAPAHKAVDVLQQVKIDALDISVVRGGGGDVTAWAGRNGFPLTPDAPRVLGSYPRGIFALARFDRADAARRGLIQGQGETIHFIIPTPGPWIPLRILALGKVAVEPVDADLFLLTDSAPTYDVSSVPGTTVVRSEPASPSLLRDLRIDRGMSRIPRAMWFTALRIHAPAGLVRSDLAVDAARAAAGELTTGATGTPTPWWHAALALAMAVSVAAAAVFVGRGPGGRVSSRSSPAATA